MISPNDIRALRQEITAAGLFERREGKTTAKLAFFLAMAIGLIAVHTQLPVWGTALLLPVTTFFLAAAAMVGHEGGHRSFSSSTLRNEALYHFLFPLLGGLGSLQWKDKHNVRHHGHPNVVNVDDDMEIWPLAHTRAAHLKAGRVRQFVQRHAQGWIWWPMTTLFTWSMKVDSVGFLIRYAKKHGTTRAWWFDATAQLMHYVVWLVVPSIVWGFLPVFAFYLALFGMLSLMLGMVFTPGHMGLPIHDVPPDGWTLQFVSSRNLQMPRWLSFFFIGLDYQIEHHLFPKIPHANLPRAAAIVEPWAERVGVRYNRMPYLQALAAVTRYVGSAWKYDALTFGVPDATPAAPPVAPPRATTMPTTIASPMLEPAVAE